MKKHLSKNLAKGSSLALAALLFSCTGGGDGSDTTSGTSPYSSIAGTVTTSTTSTSSISQAGVQLGGVNISYIAALALDDNRLVYTADDIDENGNFDLVLKRGLKYAFILFDENRRPIINIHGDRFNSVEVEGEGYLEIELEDSDNDGRPDNVNVDYNGSLVLVYDPDFDDGDDDSFPDNIENYNSGGSPNPDYDEDGDGIFDGIEDDDNDSIIDGKEDSNNSNIPDTYEDDDNDNLPNYMDDNDGDGYRDHIDDDDYDHYNEFYAVVQSVDASNNTIVVSYNGMEYTVQITDNTQCEIDDRYYYGTDCFNYITAGMLVEIKTTSDFSQALEIEPKEYEIKGFYKEALYNTDTYQFKMLWGTKELTVKIDDNTKCEIDDRYYYGINCFNQISNLQPDTPIEVETYYDVYNLDSITAVEIEKEDD